MILNNVEFKCMLQLQFILQRKRKNIYKNRNGFGAQGHQLYFNMYVKCNCCHVFSIVSFISCDHIL